MLIDISQIGPNVSIGPRAVIGKGVRIKDAIILDNVVVNVSFVYVITGFICMLRLCPTWVDSFF
jgi:mannose-1-phosphate guanylyltransferase